MSVMTYSAESWTLTTTQIEKKRRETHVKIDGSADFYELITKGLPIEKLEKEQR